MKRIIASLILALTLVCVTACGYDAFAASKGQVFQTLLTGLRFDGATLSGGKVYFYSPGTTTAKAIYTDRLKTTPASNPYTLDSNGQAAIFGDGVYDIKVTTSAGTQKAYWYNVALQDYTSVATAIMSDYSSLTSAVSAIGSTPTRLVINQATTVTSNTTVPSTLELDITVKGSINQSSFELVLNGPFNSAPHTVFTGTGAVTFGRGIKITPEIFGATGGSDDTTYLQYALNSFSVGGELELIKTYTASALTLSKSDVKVSGNGQLTKKASVDGVLLKITGNRNKVEGLKFNGTASGQTPNSTLNDIIQITGGNDNLIIGNAITGSAGNGVQIYGGARNRIAFNNISGVSSNSIGVADPGADDNVIIGNTLNKTTNQNNIYITASSDGSSQPSNYVYNNKAIGNTCINSGDTGIEAGYHAVNTTIDANIIKGSVNPGILLRDCQKTKASHNNIEMPSNAAADAVAVVPLHESENWDYDSEIAHTTIRGKLTRSGIYLNGDNLYINDNDIAETSATVDGAGAGLIGAGIMMATGTSSNSNTIKNNKIYRVSKGIDLNFGAGAITHNNLSVSGNIIDSVDQGINYFNTTMSKSDISRNEITKVVSYAFSNVSSDGGNTSYLVDNKIVLTGWSGTGTMFSSASPLGFLFNYKTVSVNVPYTQNDSVTLSSDFSGSFLTLEWNNGAEYAVIYIYPEAGTGDGKGYTVLKSSTNIANAAAGATAWAITNFNGTLLLKRYGTTTTDPGKMRFCKLPMLNPTY